ncbi:uncharacterized protein LOC112182254 isoform X3 [Rosa chinensis]|nr:uncharacterized protein LOC112182254 isoform X3 [Rosa chinensis]
MNLTISFQVLIELIVLDFNVDWIGRRIVIEKFKDFGIAERVEFQSSGSLQVQIYRILEGHQQQGLILLLSASSQHSFKYPEVCSTCDKGPRRTLAKSGSDHRRSLPVELILIQVSDLHLWTNR